MRQVLTVIPLLTVDECSGGEPPQPAITYPTATILPHTVSDGYWDLSDDLDYLEYGDKLEHLFGDVVYHHADCVEMTDLQLPVQCPASGCRECDHKICKISTEWAGSYLKELDEIIKGK